MLLIIYQSYQSSILYKKIGLFEKNQELEREFWVNVSNGLNETVSLGSYMVMEQRIVHPDQLRSFEFLIANLLKPYTVNT